MVLMAKRRPARPRAAPSKKSPSRVRQVAPAVFRWLWQLSRPRTPSQGMALLFVLLAIGTLAGGALAALHARSAVTSLLWALVLLAAALAARTFPLWRAELARMTPDRARLYASCALLLFAAFSLSGHILLESLGWGSVYPLLGPLSSPPGSILAIALAGGLGFAYLLALPLHRWLGLAITTGNQAVSEMRQRRVIEAAAVETLPLPVPSLALPRTEPRPVLAAPEPAPVAEASLVRVGGERPHPPLDLFTPAPKAQGSPIDVDLKAQRIQETLASFSVGARVVGHHCGPVVTQFDIQPDRGVKVRRITELQNDLALALAAPTIRIQAPVPGKPVVGIEIPNTSATVVTLRELLETEAYRSFDAPLRVALGKDVAGQPKVIDLAKMPHLLIAGATGSGKSACINALISCLLYNNTPDEVRLLMIDPKVVELTVYNGVPHLLSDVVTEMDKVVGVLQWALREMERRYRLFRESSVRNIGRYNEKMAAHGLKTLPYVVLIVDELADLMMVSPEDVEDAICRLAQLARAAGIHLVIATQRPSVDVVTGLIKANFPARIAFAMTSQVDSRTILDTAGAEKLLGRGDMLYQPPDAPKPLRLQGAFLSDQEVERLVEFWKERPESGQTPQVAEEEFVAAAKEASDEGDELLDEATRVVREYQHASVSLLQRRLRVGYARAARLMDQLEERGVVGPSEGGKQRPVLEAGEDGS